jgi:hypothetical protein
VQVREFGRVLRSWGGVGGGGDVAPERGTQNVQKLGFLKLNIVYK